MMELALLGATGSIGTQTLDVMRLHRDEITLVAATCGSDADALYRLTDEFKPELTGVVKPREGFTVRSGTLTGANVNERAILESGCDTVLDSVVGMAGLGPVMTALTRASAYCWPTRRRWSRAANWSPDAARRLDEKLGYSPDGHMPPRSLTPVDSEHSAIFQAMATHPGRVKRLILTASGGPFRTWTREQIAAATPAQALNHPTWRMGGKVTIDSATLMNKGLEITRGVPAVLNAARAGKRAGAHPQSIVHSMVEFEDGSVLAQLAVPDMRGPIAYALGYPDRIASGVGVLELAGKSLTFEEPDESRFPCLRLAYEAMKAGGGMPCVMNAADESAVSAFLRGKTDFYGIADVVERTLEHFSGAPAESVEQLIELGSEAKAYAAALIAR